MYNTVKLVCRNENNEDYFGTGFIYKFFRNELDSVPVIVSNTHVLNDARIIFLTLHASNDMNQPIPGTRSTFRIIIDEEQKKNYFRQHPDTDLSIFPFGKLVNDELTDGRRPYYSGFDSTIIPNDQEWDSFNGLEEVLLIGYPHGIMDITNNFPIFIRGHTATHPNIDYNGIKEFLVNANVHAGSSGSPTILINENFINRSKTYADYSGVKLLGILYSGFTVNYKGHVLESKIENIYRNGNEYNFSINICKIIKSTRLRDFEPELKKQIEKIA